MINLKISKNLELELNILDKSLQELLIWKANLDKFPYKTPGVYHSLFDYVLVLKDKKLENKSEMHVLSMGQKV